MSTSNCKEKDEYHLESTEQGMFYSVFIYLSLPVCLDYKQIDKQLDQIDAVLSNLENKRDNLHEEAVKLLHETREIRSLNKAEQEQQQSLEPPEQ